MPPTPTPTPTRTIRPQPGPQTAFLATSADIAVYGGAAGGGKTWALLAEPLRHVHRRRFGAVIFRRESPQITNEGGLWDESNELYPLAGGVPRQGELDWRFPSGAKVSFRHLQHESDKQKWQGAQVPLLGFDELTHFSAGQFWYLISRNRSTSGVRPYVRGTTNPEPGWVKEFLAQWVDRTHPDPARSGEIRWFVRVKGELVWAHERDDLVARFPGLIPRSATFIKASVFDNKILLSKNPEYLGNLQALPRVERARLLDGDWDVKREGLILGELLDCVVGPDEIPPYVFTGSQHGGIDYGWNHPFCGLRGWLYDDVLWVDWERYESFKTVPQHSDALPRSPILWYADPARADSTAELCGAGHDVTPCVHLGQRPILDGIDKIQDRIRTGRIKVSRACQGLLREAGLYAYDPKTGQPVDKDNHACDALRYLVVGLDRGRAVRTPPPPPPTPEQVEAERKAAEDEAARRRAEFLRPDNPHWWNGDDDA